MEAMIKHESTIVDTIQLTIAAGMQTASTNMAIIDVPNSDRSFHGYSDTEALDSGNERPSKKPKVEEQIVEYQLAEGFLDPINHPDKRSTVFSPQSIVEHGNGDNNPKPVVPSIPRQFGKAGDYEGSVKSDKSISQPGGTDHLRVHPKFLHSNATSHEWALGAFAELLDNSLDEVRTGATYVNVDVLNDEQNARNKMLLVEDNGGGMTPDKMRECMSLGYSVKSKLAYTIGQYGNGFKTSTMRLGADVLVFSRCLGQGARSSTQSIGMLSYTFLMETGEDDTIVPMIDFEKRGEEWGMLVRSSDADWKRNMETIARWSPYSSEESLLQQFGFLKDQGTRIIIYNLWEDEKGQPELDFNTDLNDIQIRGVNTDPKKIDMAKGHPNSRHFLTYRHSLRSYAAILYLSIPNGFRIILRGKEVIHHNIIDDMMLTKTVMYKPTQPTADGPLRNDQHMMALVTLGFVKDAKEHIDVQGFNVYHKNRLIKPFWRVWNAAGSDGRGVIGVVQADFIKPTHTKQGLECTTVLSRLVNRLIAMQKKYWSTNCQEIGYAKRCKSVSDTKSRHSIKDKSNEDIVPTRVDTHDARLDVKPIRKHEPFKPVVSAQNDEMPEEAYTYTPRKNQCKASTPLKESKGSIRSLPSEITTNGHGDESGSYTAEMISTLRKENLELRQRLGSESVVINNLLEDLRSERDKNVLLENQLLMAQETIEKHEHEQINLLDFFSEERQRLEEMEDTLKKKLQEAMNTVEELRGQTKLLENRPLVKVDY